MYIIYRCPHDIDNEVRLGRWVTFEAVFVPLESPPALYFSPFTGWESFYNHFRC